MNYIYAHLLRGSVKNVRTRHHTNMLYCGNKTNRGIHSSRNSLLCRHKKFFEAVFNGSLLYGVGK